jgi:hypothetical protein
MDQSSKSNALWEMNGLLRMDQSFWPGSKIRRYSRHLETLELRSSTKKLGLEEDKPPSSAMKRERPMPTGAKNVLLCFSAASMIMVKTSWAVRNISMKSPWARLVPPLKLVVTARGPGNKTETTPADAIAPSICAMKTKPPRAKGTAPMRHSPRVTYSPFSSCTKLLDCNLQLTAGLKRPPDIL